MTVRTFATRSLRRDLHAASVRVMRPMVPACATPVARPALGGPSPFVVPRTPTAMHQLQQCHLLLWREGLPERHLRRPDDDDDDHADDDDDDDADDDDDDTT